MEEQNNNPVLFLDSGIGGIPYCRHFHRRNPGVPIVYLADRLHFPYGKREKGELVAILTRLMEQIIGIFDPKIIVFACNTASIAALAPLRERFPTVPFVGTVPAVKPASFASKTGKIGVLGTEFTVTESYIRELAAEFGGEIVGIAAPDLVEFIECCNTSVEDKQTMIRQYMDRFRTAGADVLVLGCTHFLFLLDEFRREAAPDITVFESLDGISLRIESLLAEMSPPKQQPENKGTAPSKDSEGKVENRLLLTGDSTPESSWTGWAAYLGFSLGLLGFYEKARRR
jgi:glutamate racemase